MILYWLLSFSVIYLFITSFIMIRNRYELTPLSAGEKDSFVHKKVSVCIPARNEEKNIANLLDSLVNQTHPLYDIHVLDDDSDDNTYEIADRFRKSHPDNVFLHRGLQKPDDWIGKSWACQQLGQLSDGEIIVFLDADTRVQEHTLSRIALSMETTQAEMITVWPRQVLYSFWERTVIPFVYYALVSLLPVAYTYRDPRWLPSFLKKKMRPAFAVANGQCIAFQKTAYLKIGGHSRVRNSVLEDVQIAREARSSGLTLRMFNGTDSISCRMYRNEKELFDGLRKNFMAAFRNSVFLFLIAGTIQLTVYLLPFIALPMAVITNNFALFNVSVSAVLLILLHRIWLARWFGWDPLYAFTHPLGVLWFLRLGVIKIADSVTGYKPEWKSRKV